ncbi:MAG TPA: hypothetical protein VF665_04730 [Longimicrobium sp.]|jgi:ADP-ribose pyrophosphatase YjhB (NUDIX family)|uniref:NUDIX hydrolase n=1 Tax=Longimicrobium sp. TaxID=2029185 RepID=UPI002ED98400
MPTQVYAVVHDGHQNFLLAIKNDRGYFFHNPNGPGGAIVPAGQQLNGGGSYALPGGGLAGAPADGARQEFLEETNVDLAGFQFQLHPAAYNGVQSPQWDYWGVFFQVSQDDFQTISSQVEANLDACTQASNAVRDGTYGAGQYVQLRAAFPGCPADDELDSIHEWNLAAQWPDIQQWQGSQTLGWYYNILDYWRQNP